MVVLVLSTIVAALVGCAVHVGLPPVAGPYAVGAVAAPVSEPGIDALLEVGLRRALAARGVYDPAAVRVDVAVVTAELLPARRAGATLVYEARLVVRFEVGERAWTATRTRSLADPGSAAAARVIRDALFAALAEQVAEDGVSWLLSP
jgi:hypothetical protein